ncbi:hypothetical protein [Thioclava kandeliae]|uniref:Uncharacterized protein n=1 Tax=Thioclava kandeliae TaxID=3070818 RepID=A0ABV1SEH1_9RHOB
MHTAFLATIALCLTTLCLAKPAGAGPWMREKGTAFLSFGHEFAGREAQWTSLYAEYGLSARNTLVLEYGRGEKSEEIWLGWQIPLLPPERHQKLSLGTWIGERKLDGEGVQMYGVGLNWGMGFTDPLWRKNGWLAAEFRHMRAPETVTYDPAAEGIDPMTLPDPSHLPSQSFSKLDLTVGWHLRQDWMGFGQLLLYKPENDDLSSSLAVSLVKDFRRAQLQIGMVAPLADGQEPRLKLALWSTF